jgi:cytochrome b pre-mRNA-processing protein 3
MFRALFARLTGEPRRGQALFGLAVRQASETHWFVAGQVPDTVNGRFAVLATIAALIIVRLERAGPDGEQASVALTERLVEALDAEIREMGLGDPTLGKQVRKLVGALAARVERWRTRVDSDARWTEEVQRSLYLEEAPGPEAVEHSEKALKRLWQRLLDADVASLSQGRME